MSVYQHSHICTPGQSVEVGGSYQYYEDGMVAQVTVLEDQSDDEGIGFLVRIDKCLNWPSDDVGREFQCWTTRENHAYSGMWRLYGPDEYAVLS